MLVANDLTINGGYFNGTAKGMDYLAGNVAWSERGYGGSGGSTYQGGNINNHGLPGKDASTPVRPCLTPDPDTCQTCPAILLGLKGT
jgi:hypothetical protein